MPKGHYSCKVCGAIGYKFSNICPVCGKHHHERKVYCSDKCEDFDLNRLRYTCECCGSTYSEKNKFYSPYCSLSCHNKMLDLETAARVNLERRKELWKTLWFIKLWRYLFS